MQDTALEIGPNAVLPITLSLNELCTDAGQVCRIAAARHPLNKPVFALAYAAPIHSYEKYQSLL